MPILWSVSTSTVATTAITPPDWPAMLTSTSTSIIQWSLIQNPAMWNTSTIQAYHSTGTQRALAPTDYYAIDPLVWHRHDVEAFRLPTRLLSRPAIHSGRRALRRSIELYRRLRGPAELARFLAGQSIEVEGSRYAYRMQQSRHVGLLAHTMRPHTAHTPYVLHALDKVTRLPLASGCVVMQDTPVIDQLLAVVMHTQDRDAERHLIANTNWTPRLAA